MLYTVGRICAVLIRPLLLFVANNYFPPGVAAGLAVAFLASSLAMLVIAADSQRVYYTRYFGVERQTSPVVFYVYVVSLMLLTIVGSALVLAISLRATGSPALALAVVAYFASEKLADEVLRLRLFEHDFAVWGKSTAIRAVLQVITLGLMVLIGRGHVSSAAVVALLSVANYLVFVPQVPLRIGRVVHPRHARTLAHLARRAAAFLVVNWRPWAVALLGAAIGYIDRIVVLVLNREFLPLFTLVVMCFSIVQLAVDFFYVSRRRREFLQQRISLRTALFSRQFMGSLGMGLLAALTVTVAVLRYSRGGSEFPMLYVAVVAILQTCVAVTPVPQQILYWNRDFQFIIRTEIAFWTLVGLSLLAAWRLRADPSMVFVTLAVCALARVATYFALAARVPTIVTVDPQPAGA